MKKLFLTAFVLLGLVFVSQAQTKHTIGEKFGGGIVFDVSADGLHGLVAETIDQGMRRWQDAPNLIADAKNHSEKGKVFTDWRLPTKDELTKLYKQKTIVGGFTNNLYWSSSEYGTANAWGQNFSSGMMPSTTSKINVNYVRAVRVF